ncbi:hypothetical protein LJK88_47665 [Paenibacillus sp. P26]|nr:hypothetical protein LJK88_47665 [Paenibacillus sp. P26]UUZ91766.1 hypothetical protein LJK87_40670 [Paenibacillus sp. P25]
MTVNVAIVPSVTKTLEAIPLSIIGQNDGFDTKVVLPESGQLNLVVEGSPSIIDKLKTQDVQAILDVSNLPPGRHEVPVTWNLPTFVKKVLSRTSKPRWRSAPNSRRSKRSRPARFDRVRR